MIVDYNCMGELFLEKGIQSCKWSNLALTYLFIFPKLTLPSSACLATTFDNSCINITKSISREKDPKRVILTILRSQEGFYKTIHIQFQKGRNHLDKTDNKPYRNPFTQLQYLPPVWCELWYRQPNNVSVIIWSHPKVRINNCFLDRLQAVNNKTN